MRFCTQCKQITTGQPIFCNRCGRSYNLKLCPRLHVNPRSAEVCSQCGSLDLSTPQPKLPLVLRPVAMLLGLGPGVLFLLIAGVYLAFYIRQLITDPSGLLPLMCLGFLLGCLLLLWMMLPRFLRNFLKGIGRLIFKRRNKEGRNRQR